MLFGASEIVLSCIKRPGAGAKIKDRSSYRIINVIVWPCVILSTVAAYNLKFARIDHAGQYYPVGFLLWACGIALRWWSISVLGRYFTVKVAIAQDHRIVRTGPYRLLRHPSYTGVLLACLGLGICIGNWVSLVLLVVPTTFALLWRIRIEEEALTEAFGAEYGDYSAKTYRLMPFLY